MLFLGGVVTFLLEFYRRSTCASIQHGALQKGCLFRGVAHAQHCIADYCLRRFQVRSCLFLCLVFSTITCSDIAQSPPQQFVLRTYEHTSPGKGGLLSCTLLEQIVGCSVYLFCDEDEAGYGRTTCQEPIDLLLTCTICLRCCSQPCPLAAGHQPLSPLGSCVGYNCLSGQFEVR